MLLIILPWSTFWDRNYFGEALPWLGRALNNNFVRGAVSGLGLVNCYVGLIDLAVMILRRHDAGGDPRSPAAGEGVA